MLRNKDFSLFAPQALSEKHHRGLLLQFLLSEIFEAHRALQGGKCDLLLSDPPSFFPYDWGRTIGYLNKLQEHTLLLKTSFPDHASVVKDFELALRKQIDALFKKRKITEKHFALSLQRIYASIEPLIALCKENENLLFFLLKNRCEVDALTHQGHLYTFILKIHPGGLETLGEKMCDQYHRRGFFAQISEFKLLLTELTHA